MGVRERERERKGERETDRQGGGREEGESKKEREGDRAIPLVDRYNTKRDRNISLAVQEKERQRQ